MSPLPSFTVFDVETTGLDPREHRVIEIAGIRIENGAIQHASPFHAFVNPEREIPWEAKQINGISDETVVNAPTIDQVLPKFLTFAQGSMLIAHNAEFDMRFLEKEKSYCWGYTNLPECLCTMHLSRNIFPREFRHNLDALSLRLKLSVPQDRHRALPDVLLTAEALLKMMALSDITSLEELRQKAGMHAQVERRVKA